MHTNNHLHRRCTVIWLAALVMGATAVQAPAQVGLGLAPMRLELRLSPGGRQSGALMLSNGSNAKTRIRAELLDFYVDQTETPQFGRAWPREAEYSCRQWLTINPMELDLEPGGSTLVRYTVDVPKNASERGFHCAAGFTTMSTPDEPSQTGLKTAVRIVATFYVVVGNPAVEGRVKDIRLERISGAEKPGWRAVVVIGNESVTHFRPTGELAVLKADGSLVEAIKFRSIPVLPKREQAFLFPLSTPLDEGRYTLRARVDLGTNEIQEATASVMAQARER